MKTSGILKFPVLFIILLSVILSLVFTGCISKLPIKLNDASDESVNETGTDVSDSAGTGDTGASQGYENDFTLTDLDGNEVSLHDYKGKIVVLNFWATWCPPCQAEIPDFVEVYDDYKDKGVQFFGISDDFDKSLQAFEQQYKINYPTLLDGTPDKVFAEWGIDAIPHTFILDENGKIVFDQLGMMSKDQLVSAIEAALAANQ